MKIEMKYIRGQGYDGAASMSGRFNGVQSCIKKEYKTAIYIHCSAHSLNLAITYACGVQCIRNTMGTIEKVFVFLNTPKRSCIFKTCQRTESRRHSYRKVNIRTQAVRT